MRSLRPIMSLMNCSTAALTAGVLCSLCWVHSAQAQAGSPPPNAPVNDQPAVPKSGSVESKPAATAPAKAESPKTDANKAGSTSSGSEVSPDGAAAPKPPDAKTQRSAKKASADGEKAYKAADFASALTHFEESEALVPSAAAEFWIADCLDKLGRLDEALPAYGRFWPIRRSIKRSPTSARPPKQGSINSTPQCPGRFYW